MRQLPPDRSNKGFRAGDAEKADEFHRDQALMCSAHGCPMRWSVDAGRGTLCSTHAHADTRDWPRLTQWLQDQARAGWPRPTAPQVPSLSREQRLELLQKLQKVGQGVQGHLGGAWRLYERDKAGDKTLTPFQRDYYRTALRHQLHTLEAPGV
ncbi:hypothetical protein UFOVP703_80 [uncultured Caudovirales phage]|uniref:Uncharacterized protein n=1 Tax=uncultured Caudovirales phage TaxID=2100421 RepID=A0A6J5NIX6_9CAUD|nr:hypothetical protein UFOVP703_80 [uncultured Caudovirales phage]